MRILVIATSSRGGAGTAARRSFLALRNSGADASFISLDQQIGITLRKKSPLIYFCYLALRRANTSLQRILVQKSDELFTGVSLNFLGCAYRSFEKDYDVIHFHSTYNFADYSLVKKLIDSSKKVVFTMHDERLSTGGCHYSGNCEKMLTGCHGCPLVTSPFQFIPSQALKHSVQFIGRQNRLSVIAPSKWLAEKAEKSPVMRDKTIKVVHNPIPELFFDASKNARKHAGSSLRLGFISQDLYNPYKGFDVLIAALNELEAEFASEINLTIATGTSDSIINTSINYRFVHPESDEDLKKFYSEIDLLVVPSHQDNSPSVIGEALACGVPVIGASVGGISELLTKFGQVAFAAHDSGELRDAIVSAFREGLHAVDSQAVYEALSEERYAEKVLAIYKEATASQQ